MPKPLHIVSESFRPLAALGVIQQGAGPYYREVLRAGETITSAGAWAALVEQNLVGERNLGDLIPFCRFGVVRRKAFALFQQIEPDLAMRVAEVPRGTAADAEQVLMTAQLNNDFLAAAEACGQLYLESGDLDQLGAASVHAEVSGGWRAGLDWALKAVVIAPLSTGPLRRLFTVLESSARVDLIREFADILAARNLHVQLLPIFLALAAERGGDAAAALERLRPYTDERVSNDKVLLPYLGAVRAMRAQAEEKLGRYDQAYRTYTAINEAERSTKVDPANYVKGLQVRSKLNVPAHLPAPTGTPVTQMIGFPRSGTTLLENALAAHPRIETFEEVPALTAAIDRIERVLTGRLPPEPSEATFLAARDRYYEEIERRRLKDGADILVDKMPIRSGDAALITKLFPEWRYIFSIRHPFDVVLSCFKQRFVPNPAMENFRSIAQGARLYDLCMTEWFKVRSLDSTDVRYVRYEDLVTNFEPTIRGALDFVGAEWDPSVLEFSKAAESRAARTPSYQKVRQGLSIGVQTQWRNYKFAFEGEPAKLLGKWADFFGYEWN